MASPQRLTRTADLELVRREGKRVRTALLEVRVLASLLRAHRIGIIVPRHKQSAVARNRLKRRLRELARREWSSALQPLPPHDVVLRAAPAAYAADFTRLAREMQKLGARVAEVAA
ncbi:MAG: ribonuclease P protein component [Gemmatimonadaceae bacterium]|nr:ribonuclease P protein component [Gemmatimonadaceae bacterium]